MSAEIDEPPLADDTLARSAGLTLQGARVGVEDALRCAGEMTDFYALVDVLVDLRDLKALVAAAFTEVECLAMSVMPEKKSEVPGVGIVEAKKGVRRTKWQHDEVFKHVLARVIDTPGVFYDEEGTALYPAQAAANVVERLRDVLSPSWKVGGLRSLGLQPDEFCEQSDGEYGLMLPPRAVA